MSTVLPPTTTEIGDNDLFFIYDSSGAQKRLASTEAVYSYVRNKTYEIVPWIAGTYAIDPSQRFYFKNISDPDLSHTYTAPNASVNNPVLLTSTPIGNTDWIQWEATAFDLNRVEEELLGVGSVIYPNRTDLYASESVYNQVPEGATHLRLLVGDTYNVFTMDPSSFGEITSITYVDSIPTEAIIGGTTVTLTQFLLNNATNNAIADFEDKADAQLEQQEQEFQEYLEGKDEEFNSELANAFATLGYTIVGNFTDGCVVNNRSEAVYYAGDPNNNYAYQGVYVWNDTYPKTVTAGTDPISEEGWSFAATGYTKQSGAIMLFGQTIDVDQTIPVGQNGLSVNPTILQGKVVSVSPGSIWRL